MKYFNYIVIGVVVVAVLSGFFIVGSPKEERARRFDAERVQSLQFIQAQIGEFYRAKSRIPQNLMELNDEFRGITISKDPETGNDFEYRTREPLQFTLCATFNRPSRDQVNSGVLIKPRAPYYGHFGVETWEHKEGKTCFDRTVDPDFLKPLELKR